MTSTQKQQILKMRGDGAAVTQIADNLGLSVNTVKSFLRRSRPEAVSCTICKECGGALVHTPGARTKIFCSDDCRYTWWGKHRSELKRRHVAIRTCAHCGTEFEAYTNSSRMYCGHPCYITARFGERDKCDERAI